MPKTATARNKATNWNKGGMLGKKKKFLLSRENGSVGRLETETFFGVALVCSMGDDANVDMYVHQSDDTTV